MQQDLSRKKFLRLISLSTGSLVLLSPFGIAQESGIQKLQKEKGPPLKGELVKEFVTVCHGNLGRSKDMLAETPALLNACWDWGGGDFETGIEGAGHVGNRELAEFLLANGARMNIFCAAMLGKIEIVKSILTAFPELKTSKGPHGLQLMHHAKKGGENAKEVLQYLESIEAS